jgi:hypothetical protein
MADDEKKDDDGKHAKKDPAQGDGQVPKNTPIPKEPKDDGKHNK